jgi:hypothetical protein
LSLLPPYQWQQSIPVQLTIGLEKDCQVMHDLIEDISHQLRLDFDEKN